MRISAIVDAGAIACFYIYFLAATAFVIQMSKSVTKVGNQRRLIAAGWALQVVHFMDKEDV
jgi:hypothetical protein